MPGPGLAVGVAFAIGIFLIFLDIDRSRTRKTEQSVATAAAMIPDGYIPTPVAQATLRNRLGDLFQPAADRISERGTKRGKRPLAEELARADLKLRTSEYLMIQIGTVAVLALLVSLRFGISVPSVIAAVVGYFIPGQYVKFRQGQRLSAFNNQLADTLILLANALRTGYSFPQAIDVAAKKGVAPMSSELSRVVREMNLGTTTEDALAKMVVRVGSPDFDLVTSAVAISTSLGGNLSEILDTISGTIRERVRIKGEISTMTAQARMSGYIITGLPIALAVFMYFVTPNYFRPMTENFVGWIMIALALFLIGLGQTIIRKVIAIKV